MKQPAIESGPTRSRSHVRAMCWLCRGLAVSLALVLSTGCGESPSTLDPQGPAAARLAGLWWFILALATFVFIAVMAFLLVGLHRSRRPLESRSSTVAGMSQTTFIVLAGAAIPFVILVVLFVQTVRTMAYFSEPPEQPSLTIEMTGWMWWWEIRYLDDGIVTANELHIPVGQYVEIRTTGADVIHAVWPSQLAGKIDSIPGEWNTLWLRADAPGVYRGQCAEFCGIQHTNMDFLIVALPVDEYESWLAARQSTDLSTPSATTTRGAQVFEQAQCALCHAIHAPDDDGIVGPDLTHLADRSTLGSALFPNTRENLRAWIIDPHGIKPGVKMPGTSLSDEDMDALLDYLETLQ